MMSVDGGSNIIVSSTLNKSGKYFILEYDENQQFVSSTEAPEYSTKATFKLNEETTFINIDLGNGTEPCTIENTGNFIVEYEKIFILNGNNIYEEFRKKEETNITTGVEFKTNKTRNGKRVYGKEIDFGAMPNNTSKTVPHGITNGGTVVDVKVICTSSSGSFGAAVFPHTAAASQYMELQITTQSIFIACNKNMSNFNATVTIYYTKN